MDTLIRTEKLCCSFQSGRETVTALKDIDLNIQRGMLTILRGPSGSGKTTCINILGALEKPSSGKVYFDGMDITTLLPAALDELRRLHMGFVFQSIALISCMSAYENVEFALRIAGCDPLTRRERAENCLHKVGMYKRRDHRPHELSGGEQQRVAIARAMVHSPGIIFADEPTSALDTALGLQVVALFKSLVESDGLTILMTTHDPHIMQIADRMYTLENGRLQDACP